jgi:DNA-binding PadR family transcriptional regulator
MTDDIDALLPLPYLSHLVLLALAEGKAHGWEIIKRIRELTAGETNPSSGSLYLAIVRLEARGLLDETAAPAATTDARRRYYRLTPFGRRVLAAETTRLERLVARARELHVLGKAALGDA